MKEKDNLKTIEKQHSKLSSEIKIAKNKIKE